MLWEGAACQSQFTRWLEGCRRGDRESLDAISSAVYPELKRIAAAHLARMLPGQTLQPTALVHEFYMRAAGAGSIRANDKGHFLAIAGRVMRQILVQHARSRNAEKRGGGWQKLTLDECLAVSPDGSKEILALDDALSDLARTDARKAQIVELRYFGGLKEPETAELLDISISTVGRELRLALAWLYRRSRKV